MNKNSIFLKKKYNYIFILVFLLLFALFCSCQKTISEGYGALGGKETPITKSDFYTILLECIENINEHDVILEAFDKKYKKNTIKIEKNENDNVNVQRILAVLKKQDNEISKLLKTYMPNPDLDGLINGELLKPIERDLDLKSTYSETPIDCDPVTVEKSIKKYEELLAELSDPEKTKGMTDDDKKTAKTTYGSMIVMFKLKLADLQTYLNAPGNTKCTPPLTKEDAKNLLNGFYANYILKIVNSHKKAIHTIQANFTKDMVNFYALSSKIK